MSDVLPHSLRQTGCDINKVTLNQLLRVDEGGSSLADQPVGGLAAAAEKSQADGKHAVSHSSRVSSRA